MTVSRVSDRPDPGAPGRIIVAGAGLAGLTAAIHLRDAGWDVLVLEARERVGGRVHTLYGGDPGVPLDPGLRVDVGGESVDDTHAALLGMVRRFGLDTERRPGSTSDRRNTGRYRYQGATFSFAELTALRFGGVLADLRRVYDELERLPEHYRLDPEHPEAADSAAELDALSMASWLDGLHLVREARFLVEQANTSLYNSQLNDLSMLFVVQQTAASAGASADQSETMRIANGNASLPRAIAAELGAALIVDAPVTSVRRVGELVGVTARDETHFGAHVVLATPPLPTRAMQFDPPLPPAIATAIAGLDLGGATKVVNQYHRPFWNDSGESGFSLSDLTYRISWDAADSYDAPGGLLTTFTTASNGRELAALPDAARIDRVRHELAQVFPESPEHLAGPAVTVAWSEEPFTGGGYAVYKPRQLSAFWEPLRAGADRIHFAGEHLESLCGYMESAVRSGIRAAARIGRR
jgi:monoamine oxidase